MMLEGGGAEPEELVRKNKKSLTLATSGISVQQ